MIPQQFIEEVQQKTDVVELIASYIPLKRAGRNFKALCPFHGEKTPSFMVSSQKQIFHCFGCNEGGSAIQFLMLYEKVTFVEAVEILAKRLGMRIPYERTKAKDKLKTVLYEAVSEACAFYHRTLVGSKQGEPALTYLQKRGITPDTIKAFRIGYAPGHNTLCDYLRKKQFTLQVLEKASLITPRSRGGYIDLFRERIVFPIYDVRARAIGFGARTLKDKENIPKYINSFENALYAKRAQLYGLNLAKDEIIKKDSVIVTEGYLDMITPYQAGIRNIVASSGTALTLEQIRLIKRYTKNVVLVFDSDKAGRSATLRALDLLLEQGLHIVIASLPAGDDLDSFLRKQGIGSVSVLLAGAEDFFEYQLTVLTRMHDASSIKGKSTIAQNMLSTINKLHSEVQKHEYIKKLAGALNVKEEVLVAEMNKLIRPPVRTDSRNEHTFEKAIPMVEKLLLKYIFMHTNVLETITRTVHSEDFSHPLTKKTFSLVANSFSHDAKPSLSAFLSMTDDKKVSGFISEVVMEDFGELNKTMLQDCIAKLKNNRLRIMRQQLKIKMREAEKNNDLAKVKELMVKFRKVNSEVGHG